MANSKQAIKRVRQANKRRHHNMHFRSMLRTYVKRVREALEAADKTQATEAFARMTVQLDRWATRGLIHQNKAARLKSRLNKQLHAI